MVAFRPDPPPVSQEAPLGRFKKKLSEVLVVIKMDFNEDRQMVKCIEGGVSTEYEYDKFANRKIVNRRGSFPKEKLARLKTREEELLKEIESADNERSKSNARQTLGFFYIHEAQAFDKAIAMVEGMPADPLKLNIMLHSIFYDERLLPDQKRVKCDKLLLEFPDQEKLLNSMMSEYDQAVGKVISPEPKP